MSFVRTLSHNDGETAINQYVSQFFKMHIFFTFRNLHTQKRSKCKETVFKDSHTAFVYHSKKELEKNLSG